MLLGPSGMSLRNDVAYQIAPIGVQQYQVPRGKTKKIDKRDSKLCNNNNNKRETDGLVQKRDDSLVQYSSR